MAETEISANLRALLRKLGASKQGLALWLLGPLMALAPLAASASFGGGGRCQDFSCYFLLFGVLFGAVIGIEISIAIFLFIHLWFGRPEARKPNKDGSPRSLAFARLNSARLPPHLPPFGPIPILNIPNNFPCSPFLEFTSPSPFALGFMRDQNQAFHKHLKTTHHQRIFHSPVLNSEKKNQNAHLSAR